MFTGFNEEMISLVQIHLKSQHGRHSTIYTGQKKQTWVRATSGSIDFCFSGRKNCFSAISPEGDWKVRGQHPGSTPTILLSHKSPCFHSCKAAHREARVTIINIQPDGSEVDIVDSVDLVASGQTNINFCVWTKIPAIYQSLHLVRFNTMSDKKK